MLELKQVEFEAIDVLPLGQRVHMRLAGFRRGTVPALKIDGRRVQGSRGISRALDSLWPDPPLFPSDPKLREDVLEAERWGEEVLQPVPRRLARFAAAGSYAMRRAVVERQGLPMPGMLATVSGPLARYYALTTEIDARRGDEAGIRSDLAALPELLEHADGLFADGTLALDPPNAATLQVLASIRLLSAFDDFRDLVQGPCAIAARELFPGYPVHIPAFVPREWLPRRIEALASQARAPVDSDREPS